MGGVASTASKQIEVAGTETGRSATIKPELGKVEGTKTGIGGARAIGSTVLQIPVLEHLQASAPLWHRYVQVRPLRKQEQDLVSHLPLQVHRVSAVTPGILLASMAAFSEMDGSSLHPSWAAFNACRSTLFDNPRYHRI